MEVRVSMVPVVLMMVGSSWVVVVVVGRVGMMIVAVV